MKNLNHHNPYKSKDIQNFKIKWQIISQVKISQTLYITRA